MHRASARPLRALLPLASHAAVSNPSIYRNIAKGKSCYNTIYDRRFFDVNRHSAKSRSSLRMERALRFGRWDSICCGKQPLNILEVVGLRAPTAVETCHWHVSKSRPSLRMERALRSGRWDSFSAEKPRRLQSATGTLLRAAHPSVWSGRCGLGGGIPFAAASNH